MFVARQKLLPLRVLRPAAPVYFPLHRLLGTQQNHFRYFARTTPICTIISQTSALDPSTYNSMPNGGSQICRTFSSTGLPLTKANTSDVAEFWKHCNMRLLAIPRGSFENEHWEEAYKSILYWLDRGDLTSLFEAMLVFDRLLVEESTALPLNKKDFPEVFQTNLLNLMLNLWRQLLTGTPELAHEHPTLHPEAIAKKLHHIHCTSSHIKPDTQSYAMVIDAIASGIRTWGDGVAHVAEEVLRWQIENGERFTYAQPNVVVFASMMNVWSKSSRRDASQRVDSLLLEMKDLHKSFPLWDLAPNVWSYSTAISSLAREGNVERVESLLLEMHDQCKRGKDNLRPNLHVFNGYLLALAKSSNVEKAAVTLEEMERLYEAGELSNRPEVVAYTTVLEAFAKISSRDNGAADRAETFLRNMIEDGIVPNDVAYNTVLQAHVKSAQVERAEALLLEMNQSSTIGNGKIKPTVKSFSIVLSGWAKTRLPEAGNRSQSLLNALKVLASSGDIEKPDVVSYNSVIDCWARSKNRDSVGNAKRILQTIIDDGLLPDSYSYNGVIRTMALNDQLDDAERMFESMRGNKVTPDTTTFNIMLDAWVRSDRVDAGRRVFLLFEEMKARRDLYPDLFTYNTVMNFHAKAGDANRAEDLLEEMLSNRSPVKADLVTWNTLVKAWCRRKAPDRASIVLKRMIEDSSVFPDHITFNSIIGAWMYCRTPESLPQCQSLYALMKSQGIHPDVTTIALLIQACGSSNDPNAVEQGEALFQELQDTAKPRKTTVQLGKPIKAMIHMWAKSGRSDAGEKAEHYLRSGLKKAERGETIFKPSAIEFTLIIRGWERAGIPTQLKKADELLHLLMKEHAKSSSPALQPDSTLFLTVLSILAESGVTEKRKYAKRLVQLMIQYNVRPNSRSLSALQRCMAA